MSNTTYNAEASLPTIIFNTFRSNPKSTFIRNAIQRAYGVLIPVDVDSVESLNEFFTSNPPERTNPSWEALGSGRNPGSGSRMVPITASVRVIATRTTDQLTSHPMNVPLDVNACYADVCNYLEDWDPDDVDWGVISDYIDRYLGNHHVWSEIFSDAIESVTLNNHELEHEARTLVHNMHIPNDFIEEMYERWMAEHN